jgi:hypothetical protein
MTLLTCLHPLACVSVGVVGRKRAASVCVRVRTPSRACALLSYLLRERVAGPHGCAALMCAVLKAALNPSCLQPFASVLVVAAVCRRPQPLCTRLGARGWAPVHVHVGRAGVCVLAGHSTSSRTTHALSSWLCCSPPSVAARTTACASNVSRCPEPHMAAVD